MQIDSSVASRKLSGDIQNSKNCLEVPIERKQAQPSYRIPDVARQESAMNSEVSSYLPSYEDGSSSQSYASKSNRFSDPLKSNLHMAKPKERQNFNNNSQRSSRSSRRHQSRSGSIVSIPSIMTLSNGSFYSDAASDLRRGSISNISRISQQ